MVVIAAAAVVVVTCVLVVTPRFCDATAWHPATAPVATMARAALHMRPRACTFRNAVRPPDEG